MGLPPIHTLDISKNMQNALFEQDVGQLLGQLGYRTAHSHFWKSTTIRQGVLVGASETAKFVRAVQAQRTVRPHMVVCSQPIATLSQCLAVQGGNWPRYCSTQLGDEGASQAMAYLVPSSRCMWHHHQHVHFVNLDALSRKFCSNFGKVCCTPASDCPGEALA